METIHVQITPDVAERLRQLARENDRSISAEVRRAVRGYVEQHTAQAAGVAPGSTAAG